MDYRITLQNIEHINHNVVRLITDKPKDYTFTPGQATELAIDKDGWKEKKRPFTFTSLPSEDTLEFTIKIYPSHDGVTEQIEKLSVGDKLIIGDAWGAIAYQGQGTFIAGGAGITPFVAILKDLNQKGELSGNQLIFSNKEERDIIYKNNLEAWLGDDLHLILSDENKAGFANGHVDKDFLENLNVTPKNPAYICGPPAMEESVTTDLYAIGFSKTQIIKES